MSKTISPFLIMCAFSSSCSAPKVSRQKRYWLAASVSAHYFIKQLSDPRQFGFHICLVAACSSSLNRTSCVIPRPQAASSACFPPHQYSIRYFSRLRAAPGISATRSPRVTRQSCASGVPINAYDISFPLHTRRLTEGGSASMLSSA